MRTYVYRRPWVNDRRHSLRRRRFIITKSSVVTFTGTAGFTVGPATLNAVATFAPPVYTGVATLTAGAAVLAASATFSPPAFTGSSALVVGGSTLSASGSVTNPTYTASASLTTSKATLAASAIFATAVYQATASFTAGAAVLAASASFTAPVYAGTSALTAAPASLTASATFVGPVYSGTSTLTVGAATLGATGAFASGVTGTLVTGVAVLSATATFVEGPVPVIEPYLLHSPADIIRYMLIGMGIGSNHRTMPGSEWPIFATDEPNAPDNCITVYDTTGTQDGRTAPDNITHEHYGFQVRVRAKDHQTGFLKINAIARAFDQYVSYDLVTIQDTNGTASYRVTCVNRRVVIPLGKEVPNSNRRLFTLNAKAPIRRLS